MPTTFKWRLSSIPWHLLSGLHSMHHTAYAAPQIHHISHTHLIHHASNTLHIYTPHIPHHIYTLLTPYHIYTPHISHHIYTPHISHHVYTHFSHHTTYAHLIHHIYTHLTPHIHTSYTTPHTHTHHISYATSHHISTTPCGFRCQAVFCPTTSVCSASSRQSNALLILCFSRLPRAHPVAFSCRSMTSHSAPSLWPILLSLGLLYPYQIVA